jgi:hypothetical protein
VALVVRETAFAHPPFLDRIQKLSPMLAVEAMRATCICGSLPRTGSFMCEMIYNGLVVHVLPCCSAK